ncbi:CDT1-like protein a, chloroplastic [Papaver somniferum]|uniref:CDT1-like protein a, chloroplastic n=1 Tax=Papaver somniferum TaxID=3469 RepID=UPI000E70529C|nr:CDT1-like protein a, chloroplastic [Papaver somniferum]
MEGKSAELVKSSHSSGNLAVSTPMNFTKAGDIACDLPDKYKILAEIFESIGSSVRLLSLCKKLPTFQNICTQVEVFTKKRLSCSHLAQIKYILPEAIHVEKILVLEKRTMCMRQDMKVTLLLDTVETHLDQSPFTSLIQIFHQRLLKFFSNHPECCDIPEATLPVLMSRKRPNLFLEESRVESSPSSNELQPFSSASHLSSTFKRRFSKKSTPEKTNLLASRHPFSPLEPEAVFLY